MQNKPSVREYPETADIETASDGYAARFAGATGEWMLARQSGIVLDALRGSGVESILDVGGGHAQLAIPLARAGYALTVAGSSEQCRRRLLESGLADRIAFKTANLIELPYPDGHFDAAICFRFVSHCGSWRTLIGELCRVAAHAVIIDYPNRQSVNIATPLLFKLKRMIEKNTRTYTLFSHSEIEREFKSQGFVATARRNQFFLPMALHRALGSAGASAKLESAAQALGMTRLLGSPSILTATKA